MKIFFSEVQPAQYPQIDAKDLFRDPVTSNFYFYMLETDNEGTVRLHDTCGRMVPFDIESLTSFSEAVYCLTEIENMKASVAEEIAEQMEQLINSTHDYTGVRVFA